MLGYNRSCSNHCASPYRYARENGRIGAYRSSILNSYTFHFEIPIATLGMPVVAEGRIGANKHIVADPHAIPQLYTAFYCNIVADYDIILYKGVRTDIAISADSRARQNHSKLPNARTIANRLRLNVRERMYVCSHIYALLLSCLNI